MDRPRRISQENVAEPSVNYNVHEPAVEMLKDGLAEYIPFHQNDTGRMYNCGVFMSNAAVKILLALNRGNGEYKSEKYDAKFTSSLINDICTPTSTSDFNILRNFILG